jgi:hypothetical protein
MTLTRKIKIKSHKNTRKQSGGGFMDFLRSFSQKKKTQQEQSERQKKTPPPPPPSLPDEIVTLFNSTQKIGWKINPKSSYYQIFNVNPDAKDDSIRKAFNRIALYIHPDKNRDNKEGYTQLFQAISLMKNILVNPSSRARYDYLLRMYPPPPPEKNVSKEEEEQEKLLRELEEEIKKK